MSVINSQPLIGASGNQGYFLEKSLRFRSSASAYLNRTMAAGSPVTVYTFSVWVKRGELSTIKPIVQGYLNNNNYGHIIFKADNTIEWREFAAAVNYGQVNTNAVFRDPSAWYHIVVVRNGTSLTIYVNGVSQTLTVSTAVNAAGGYLFGASTEQRIGNDQVNSAYFDGYLTEINFIDGQALTPSSFGETSPSTGVWIPKKYSGTYGTNGFYLDFKDTSSTTALGYDAAGSNDWTVNNISLTSGSTYDSMTDVPTLTSATAANYCVLNPLDKATNFTLAGANLNFTPANTSDLYSCRSTFQIPSTGKWIWEVTNTNSAYMITAGLLSGSTALVGQQTVTCASMTVGSIGTFFSTSQWMNTTTTWSVTNVGNGDTLVIAYDADGGNIWFGRVASGGTTVTWYNTSGTADPSTGTDPRASSITAGGWFAGFGTYFTPSGASANFGQRPFAFTNIPTGFVALNTFNLPTPTIGATASTTANKYMNIALYTGTGSSQSITGLGFQPDLTWIKGRSGATDHGLYDAVRGVQLQLESNTTTDETTETTGLTAFGSDGFTVGALAQLNTSSATYVGWNWKESASSGFDIVTYTGNGSARTISHGLGVAPNMIIVKARTTASTDQGWAVYHSANTAAPETDYLLLNSTAATADLDTVWNDTAPTSSVFSVGTNALVNANNDTYVAYCFAQVAGYSAMGSYTGNGSSDGVFVFTGFRTRYLLIKRTDSTGGWVVLDTARDTYNDVDNYLYANSSAADAGSSNVLDINSNGFKIRNSWTDINGSGSTYIYYAVAENPFKYAVAR
jgi:hypothetical protein